MTQETKSNKANASTPEQEEARKILSRVKNESENIGSSSMARVGENWRKHFMAEGEENEDNTEKLAKRTARILALIVLVYLIVSLLQTYVLK